MVEIYFLENVIPVKQSNNDDCVDSDCYERIESLQLFVNDGSVFGAKRVIFKPRKLLYEANMLPLLSLFRLRTIRISWRNYIALQFWVRLQKYGTKTYEIYRYANFWTQIIWQGHISYAPVSHFCQGTQICKSSSRNSRREIPVCKIPSQNSRRKIMVWKTMPRNSRRKITVRLLYFVLLNMYLYFLT